MQPIELFLAYVDRGTQNNRVTKEEFIKHKLVKLVAYQYGVTDEELEQLEFN